MYKQNSYRQNTFKVNNSYQGERIEEKINRIVNNKEPISDGAPIIYTERDEGVKPEYDIRTDRWEIAVEGMDKVTKSIRAKRENKPTIGEQAIEGMTKEGEKPRGKDGEAKTTAEPS